MLKQFEKDVLCAPFFQADLILVAIDELHLVSEWGSF